MTRSRLLLPILTLIFAFSACNEISAPIAPRYKAAVKVTSCDMGEEKAALTLQYADSGTVEDFPDYPKQLILTMKDTQADGQLVGTTTYHLAYHFENGTCVRKNFKSILHKGNESLIEDYDRNLSSYFKNGVLVQSRNKLANGKWLTAFSENRYVPLVIPNWATSNGTDIYMTQVSTGSHVTVLNGEAVTQEKCIRIPVWAQEGLWMHWEGSLTLISGHVAFKSPDKNLTADELHYVLRFNAAGEIDPRGILYPVSGNTYIRHQAYMLNQAKSWERDLVRDAQVTAEIIKGVMSTWNSDKYKLVSKVLEIRGAAATTKKDKLAPEFEQPFFMVQPLTR